MSEYGSNIYDMKGWTFYIHRDMYNQNTENSQDSVKDMNGPKIPRIFYKIFNLTYVLIAIWNPCCVVLYT